MEEKEVVVGPERELEVEDVKRDGSKELKGDDSLESGRIGVVEDLAVNTGI